MKNLCICICIICAFSSKGQVRFNEHSSIGVDTVADFGYRVIQLKNKGYLSCGSSDGVGSAAFYNGAYLVKTDSLGNSIWKKQYDFSPATTFTNNATDMPRGIIELPDSNYLLLGITTNTATNDDDIFLAKIDTGGNVIWFKKYMHPDDDEATDFKLTPDGNIIIVGYTFSSGSSDDVLLIKTDINGNLLWRKRFGDVINWEKYYTIDVIKNNTEYILGGEYGYYNTGNPFFDMSIMRTDTAGNPLWQQQYGIANIDDTGKGGIPTLDSGYVLYGDYNGASALLKVSKNGVVQWIKNCSTLAAYRIVQAKQLPDSSFVMINTEDDWDNNNATGNLIKADKNGDILWKRKYPRPVTNPNIANYFFGFNTTADKGFIITGQYNHIGQPYQNMWLVKTDSLGCDSTGGCSYLPTGIGPMPVAFEGNFRVYPNPANEVIYLSFIQPNLIELNMLAEASGTHASIVVTDVLGNIVLTTSLNNKLEPLNITHLSSGVYFISIYNHQTLLGTKKFIKYAH